MYGSGDGLKLRMRSNSQGYFNENFELKENGFFYIFCIKYYFFMKVIHHKVKKRHSRWGYNREINNTSHREDIYLLRFLLN